MRNRARHVAPRGLLLLALVAAAAEPAQAQYYANVSGTQTAFIIATGATFPAGGIANRVDPTVNFMLGFQIRQANAPAAFRMDLTYQEFSGPDGWANIDALTFDAVALPEHNGETQWHAIVGLGPYYATGSGLSGAYAGYRSTTVFGINGGAGISHGHKVAVFAEVRYHLLFHNGQVLQMIPLNVGIALRG
jgi:hypothetical protein